MTQRTTHDALAWYDLHQTASSIGWDPDGKCLQVCRTARRIGPMYPSAVSAQHATPNDKRVYKLNNIRRGMVMYFDDPNDDNPFGHIVTVVGRPETVTSLADIVVWTNSVKANSLVKVRANYFQRFWGDEFQFAATWLNGQDLRLPLAAPLAGGRGPRLRHAIQDLKDMIVAQKAAGHPRLVNALERDLAELQQTLNSFN